MATDKRLDQVSQLTDFDYALIVKGTDVSKVTKQQLAELVGNLLYGATTKETLASVVAGRMGNPAGNKGALKGDSDLNSIITSGIFYLSQNLNYANIPEAGYYCLIVVRFGESDVVQFLIGYLQSRKVYFRGSGNDGSWWSEWIEL